MSQSTASLKFKIHLYKVIWSYIISLKEFENYVSSEIDHEYGADDFYSDQIPTLIESLKKRTNFYNDYQKVIGSISNINERKLIIAFMIWFKKNETASGYEIYNKFMNDRLELTPLNNLIKFLEDETLPEISDLAEEKKGEKIDMIFTILDRFTSATKPLAERRKGKSPILIDDEYDLQDILQLILKPFFPTIRIEEVVSGQESERFLKIDILIKPLKIGIECKYIRDKTHAKKIVKEINDDIQTYHKNQDCEILIFFIYDKTFQIDNPYLLEEEYSNNQSFGDKKMQVILKIRPKN